MLLTDFEIRNVRVYGGGELVAIGIAGYEIVYVGMPQDVPNFIDGQGLSVFCGRIDGHVHDRDPGQIYKEDKVSIQEAAIAGGTTTIAAMANTDPPITTVDRLRAKLASVRPAGITYLQYLGATPTNSPQFKAARQTDGCPGVKLCMANTSATGEMLVDQAQDQFECLKRAADVGLLVLVHAEKEPRIQRNLKRLCDQALALNLFHHCVIRDEDCELEAVDEILALALRAGYRLHICHVSSPRSIPKILEARRKGVEATFEFCPQYWILNDKQLLGDEGWRVKCNPPVRSPADCQAMEAYLCDESIAGAIVATDHAPHGREEKERAMPDPTLVPSGMPGLDTCTGLCWKLVAQGKMSRKRFADLTARNPAKILGLTTKGEIEPGYDADLMLIDEGVQHILRDEEMKTKCGWTPFQGMTARGAIKLVVARGQVVLNRL